MSSSLHSPNVSALLKIKILSWSQETGFPVCIRVRIAHRTFNLHKLPLTRKSGYLRNKLKDTNEVELPPNFPGGADTFEMMALFIYSSSSSSAATLLVRPSNLAALRCAAEFLHMPEEYEGLDIYLNHVVLQSWKDTLAVLHTCQALLPCSEDVLMVSRCIETVAFMACMEILDPETRGQLQEASEEADWPWIEDVVALPLAFFKRIIASLRRQGMKDKYVSPIILSYANKWVLKKWKCESETTTCYYLQGVIELVDGCRAIPVGFYLSLLATSFEVGLGNEGVEKLQKKITSLLHLAQPQDLLLPQDGIELSIMERIFMKSDPTSPAVAQLWDLYLNKVAAADPDLPCNRFITLIQTLPASSRRTHDHLYRAICAFFHSHPNLSHQEKGVVCKYIDCHKLSPQVCIEAVRNEVMPLRLMVQALFVHQLNTQQVCTEFSGTLSSSTPHKHKDSDSSPSACCELISRKDYESTSFRIENLEKELMSLKRSLELQQQISTRKNHQNNKNDDNQVTSCIASVNFATQRKYAKRILKLLQRLNLFGGARSKRKTAANHHM